MRTSVLLVTVALASGGCSHPRSTVPSQTAPSVHRRPVERRVYVISEDIQGVGGSGHDCDAEQVDCFDSCWKANPRPYPHVERGEWYYKYCNEKCRKAYLACLEQLAKEKSSSKLTFLDIDSALSWLKEHKTEVAIGTVVVVAGIAFVVATGGSGALILAPLAL